MRGHRFARACLTIVVALILVGGLVWLFRASGRPQSEIRHVVLISIDTCRADHLSCYGFGQKTTPHIDAVARDGVVFTRAHSTNPITLPAHSSMLTGTNPPYHGVHDNINYRLGDSNVTLAEILHEHGFQSAAFVGSYVLAARFGLDQGFDTYDDESSASSARIFFAERRAEAVSRRALEWLDDHGDERFFLFVHYFDPHNPYSPPEPFTARYRGDAYAGEIAYTDYCIGQVIAKLKSLGIYDSSLLVITADHGESRGEHIETTHSYFIYQNTIQVPLIVKAPGVMQGATVDEPASIIDIVPTVLGLLGERAPPSVQGADLSSLLCDLGQPVGNRYLYCESLVPTKYGCSPLRGLVHGKWKYIWTARPELYDLGRDPAEATNLIHEQPQIAEQLDERLREIVVEQGRTDVADSSLILDRQSVDQLKSLGYVGGGAVRTSLELDPNSEDPKDFIDTYVQLVKAHACYAKRQFAEARIECLEILNQRPRNQEAHMVLGIVALDEGRYADAIAHYSTYLAGIAKSSDASSKQTVVRLDVEIATAHVNLGNALQRLGQFKEAVANYKQSLRLDANNVEAHNNLGYAVEALGHPQEAIAHYQDALRIKPDYAEAHNNCGAALFALGRFKEAATHYQAALRIRPDYTYAHNNLAWLLATCPDAAIRDGGQALAHAKRVVELAGDDNAGLLDSLSAAYAELGDFEEAVRWQRKAVQIASDEIKDDLAARLELYKQGQPYRESHESAP